ncbi:hypothetical protein A9W95_18250 [Mycobacterium sp. 1423905.2]|nr:hypothetical protein A9W95_18250 [Mycobacterium sp. 1423905.2]
MMAINHPAGHLEEFWVEKVGHLWRSASESWKGIPPDVADYLAELIAEEGTRSEVVKIAFCRYLDFFYRSDAEWCKQYLYPLLDWDNSSHARQAWSGFLRHGGWSNKLLADGFLEMLVPATSHTDDLDTHGQRNLPRLLAAIAIQSDIEPRSWIRGLITKSSVPNRVVWAQAIRFQIDALGPKAVEKQWERWMRDYFSDRVSSVPRTLDPTEATAMAGWIPFLTDSMPAAIDMVLQVDTAGFSLHDLFFRDLSDDRIARAPEKVAELVHHLLKSTDGQFFGGHEIQRVYEVFKSASVSSHILHKVAEEAIRLGFTLE